MNKLLVILTVLFVFLTQRSNNYFGIYKNTQNFFYESIELKKDYTFIYNYRHHFFTHYAEGCYQIKGDSLILNSKPARDKMIVREKNKGKATISKFFITDKQGFPFSYTLYAIDDKNDTIVLNNQWKKSKIKNHKIKSFYIIISSGIKSPLYKVQGKYTNYYTILMETSRIFDCEVWKVKNDSILPKWIDGKYHDYYLLKK